MSVEFSKIKRDVSIVFYFGVANRGRGREKLAAQYPTKRGLKLIQFDLNTNDSEALLRHCEGFVPEDDDPREKRRLLTALDVLRKALNKHLSNDTALE